MRKLDFFHRRSDEDKIYIKISLCVFLVAVAIILFEKIIGHLPALGTSILVAFNYLSALTAPFLLGFAIAYVMNPFMKFFERHFNKHISYFRKQPVCSVSCSIISSSSAVLSGLSFICCRKSQILSSLWQHRFRPIPPI